MAALETISLPDYKKPRGGIGAEVELLRQRGTRTEYPLEPRAHIWLIGSSPQCEIQIKGDPYVSKIHALLQRTDKGLEITDRGSKNAVWVAGARCQHAYIEEFSTIRLGDSVLVALSAQSRAYLMPHERLVGTTEAFVAAREAALAAARARDTVVILVGESGIGKTLLAQAMHQEGPAASGPFIDLHAGELDEAAVCAALDAEPSTAVGGTIFLHRADHLGKKGRASLRALIRRVERTSIEAARLIVSSIDPAPAWIKRLAAAHMIRIPPLRERIGDIPQLVAILAREMSYGTELQLPAAEIAALAGLDWPANVRELKRVTRHMVAAGSGGQLAPEPAWPSSEQMEAALDRAMRRAIEASKNRRDAADLLGMPWTSFRRWSKKLGI